MGGRNFQCKDAESAFHGTPCSSSWTTGRDLSVSSASGDIVAAPCAGAARSKFLGFDDGKIAQRGVQVVV